MFTQSFLRAHCKHARVTSLMRSSMSSLARRRKGANEVDHAKSAINLVINTRSDDTQKAAVSDSVLSQRLNNLDNLIDEAKFCLEDCNETDSKEKGEELKVAEDSIRQACSAYEEIIDDLQNEEENLEIRNSGRKRSFEVENSHGIKVLSVILEGMKQTNMK